MQNIFFFPPRPHGPTMRTPAASWANGDGPSHHTSGLAAAKKKQPRFFFGMDVPSSAVARLRSILDVMQELSSTARLVVLFVVNCPGARTPHAKLACLFLDVGLNDAQTLASPWFTTDAILEPIESFEDRVRRLNHGDEFHILRTDEMVAGAPPIHVKLLDLLRGRAQPLGASTEAHECCVCMEGLESTDRVLGMPCDRRHLGHFECISRWVQEHASCPVCRFELPSKHDVVSTETLKKLAERAGLPPRRRSRRSE